MTIEATDADLVARARSGDDRAFGMLVARHQTVAFRTAYVICGDTADAEDAAQDAFIKARAAMGRFRAGAPFRPWLLTIVANEARNRRRAAGRRSALARARPPSRRRPCRCPRRRRSRARSGASSPSRWRGSGPSTAR